MNRPPAFQFYPKQWLGDDVVLLMDWEARGMHMHLLCIAWQQDPPCTLPDDDEMWRQWCGNPRARKWKNLREMLQRAWKKRDGRWEQDGLLREYEKQRQYSVSRQAASNARWKKTDAYALQAESVRNPLQSSSSLKNKEKRAVSTSSTPASGVKHTLNLADEEFIAGLKLNAAYQGIDIDREIGKLTAWLGTPKGRGKYLTRQRLVNWLNRADVPMNGQAKPAASRPLQVVL